MQQSCFFPQNCFVVFRALFTCGWSNAEKIVYKIPGTSPKMMGLIIEYAYTRTVPITVDNVESLLIAADQFNVVGVIQLCCEFLKSQLYLENCISICRFTDYYWLPDLREAAWMFLLHHFEEMTRVSTEFLDLSVNELKHILEKDELNAKQEAAVFEAILKWIAHDPQNRTQHIAVLLSKVGAVTAWWAWVALRSWHGAAQPEPLDFSVKSGGNGSPTTLLTKT